MKQIILSLARNPDFLLVSGRHEGKNKNTKPVSKQTIDASHRNFQGQFFLEYPRSL
jgi:hypothetical protein